MTDLEYTIRKICQRRGVTLSKIESVAFNCSIAFGLADGYELLQATANTFYYIEKMNISHVGSALSGLFHLELTSNGSRGSAGTPLISINGTASYLRGSLVEHVETDSLIYDQAAHSAGTVLVYGTVFKITYA